jgi:hypothetical protein
VALARECDWPGAARAFDRAARAAPQDALYWVNLAHAQRRVLERPAKRPGAIGGKRRGEGFARGVQIAQIAADVGVAGAARRP